MRKLSFIALFTLAFAISAKSQMYVKLNGLYALTGIINPQLEMALTPRSSFQTEMVYSPWRGVDYQGVRHPFEFGFFLNEYKHYFRELNSGWYVSGNAGLMAFRMSRPLWNNGPVFEQRYGKGWGLLTGFGGGYQQQIGERWLVDYFFSFGYYLSKYNAYEMDGQIVMYPGHTVEPLYPDPWNVSAEWLPNKLGVSIGYKIFDPAKR